MIEDTTKTLLIKIKKNNYNFKAIDKEQLVDELLHHIGDEDSYIRDDLIYPTLAHLFHEQHFNEETLTKYLKVLLDDHHLFFDLENHQKNSALTRSFSILQLVIMVNIHNRDNIISKSDIQYTYNQFLTYFKQETVLEGYRKEVGWIHTIAHGADLIDQFMQVPWFREKKLETLFELIKDKMKESQYLFQFNEEERMVNAFLSGINRKVLSREYLLGWVHELVDYTLPKTMPDKMILPLNIKHFLRALYFAVKDNNKHHILRDEINTVLKEKISL